MRNIVIVIVVFVLTILLYFGFGYLSSFVGWYGYKKWENRAATGTIKNSKERNVFIKKLHFKIYGTNLKNFEIYIEKGFKCGYNSSKETRYLNGSNYPYQVSFNSLPNDSVQIYIRQDQLVKFDSANSSWGYLKTPKLKDTIILVVYEMYSNEAKIKNDKAYIKVWDE